MVAVAIFVVTYLLITARRLNVLQLDRPSAALLGAVAMVAFGVLSPDQALAAVDLRTLVLLFAVMALGIFLERDGVFDHAQRVALTHVRTRQGLLGALVWSSGIAAAFVTNDAVAILAVPVVVRLTQQLALPALPYLLALATAVNTGSAATVLGNPQNMLCANFGGLTYRGFLLDAGPIALVCLALNHAWLAWMFRAELRGALPPAPSDASSGGGMSWASVAAVLGVAVAALAGADMAFSAVCGLAAILLWRRGAAPDVFAKLDWSILVFFAGLFVVVDGLVRGGGVHELTQSYPLGVIEALGTQALAGIFLVGSNVVSNVPFILVVRDAMATASDPQRAWTLLALASTFAGNLTLLGSVANIIVAQGAREATEMGFWDHLKVGFPLAVVSTAIAAWML